MTKGSNRPRLLRETAEIALTLIKRYIEGELMERFSMRRVSAPLFLEADSPLHDPGDKVAISLPTAAASSPLCAASTAGCANSSCATT